MRRRLYEGLLGGAEAALAWQRACTVRRLRPRTWLTAESAQALSRWEDEGGALAPGAAARRAPQ